MVNTTITHSNLTGPDSLHCIQEVLDTVYLNLAVFLQKLIMVMLSVHVRRLLFKCLKQSKLQMKTVIHRSSEIKVHENHT